MLIFLITAFLLVVIIQWFVESSYFERSAVAAKDGSKSSLYQITPLPYAKHVIIISLDTTRADHLGCYGNSWIKTPNLDALAAQGYLFENLYTPIPSTLASHTTLFTGRQPRFHGVPNNSYYVSEDNILLTQILKKAGFTTLGFIGAAPLRTKTGFSRGFDFYDDDWLIDPAVDVTPRLQRSAAAVTDSVIAELEKIKLPERLFLFVHYYDPHYHYLPREPWFSDYNDVDFSGMPYSYNSVTPASREGILFQKSKVGIVRRQYASEISYMDFHLGRLFEYLKKKNILDDAVVLVTSDHGEELGERVRPTGHGATVFNIESHTVGILRLPDTHGGGTRINAALGQESLMPTLLKYLSLKLPEHIQGSPLELGDINAFAGQYPLFCEATRWWKGDVPKGISSWPNMGKFRSIRGVRYKYMQSPQLGQDALFDMQNDPLERKNLLVEPSPEVLKMRQQMGTLLKEWSTRLGTIIPQKPSSEDINEQLEQLEALGYMKKNL
ncbi:MAG: sulfatase [Deltaproteobacteria bacterium]|nr:sulfatase [Deltaproteobacteria bacterium]